PALGQPESYSALEPPATKIEHRPVKTPVKTPAYHPGYRFNQASVSSNCVYRSPAIASISTRSSNSASHFSGIALAPSIRPSGLPVLPLFLPLSPLCLTASNTPRAKLSCAISAQ